MKRSISILVCHLVIASAAAALPAQSRASEPLRTGGEYVVTFAGSTADAIAAIRSAGGNVVDVNESLGVALVSSLNGQFLADVRGEPGVTGAARNQSIGNSNPGTPRRFADERPEEVGPPIARSAVAAGDVNVLARGVRREEPLNDLQWDMQMIGANANGAQRRSTGRGVLVGVIDTGVDASHPDIAQNFDRRLSRNFTMDIPAIDGPCETPSCIDPPDVDHGGHGTHVAGTIAARRNRIGIGGVAPHAKIVNVRAGQDSGYFFLYETVAALTYAGDAGLDVVNMSFYTDPWLYNCDSTDDYVEGSVTPEQLADQALARQLVTQALEYAHAHGVTLVGSAGNSHANLGAATRADDSSPDYPLGEATFRVVTNDCPTLPAEGPHVITVGAVGPSTTKADYSNYGYPTIDVSAPGGYFRDFLNMPEHRTNQNMVLSTYPLAVAIEDGLADAAGNPTNDASVKSCNPRGKRCGFYTYLQGTSMASPHVAGVAALIIAEHGKKSSGGGRSLDPDTVAQILLSTATDTACPAGGIQDYVPVGRPADFNAVCDGNTARNGFYGEGIVDAVAAVE